MLKREAAEFAYSTHKGTTFLWQTDIAQRLEVSLKTDGRKMK